VTPPFSSSEPDQLLPDQLLKSTERATDPADGVASVGETAPLDSLVAGSAAAALPGAVPAYGAAGSPAADPSPSETATVARRRRLGVFLSNRLGVIAGIWLLLLVVVAVFAGLLEPQDPTQTDLINTFSGPTAHHWFGTDNLGRDVLSRLIAATRISMVASVTSVGASLVIAVPLGMLAGYFGGLLDRVIGFFTDVILSIPPLILVFAIAGVLGPSLRNAVIALAVYFTPMFIRLVRTETQRIRYSQLTEAEQAIGVPHRQILMRHVLPNIAPSLVVQIALTLGTALLAEASLSFLGLGVRPPGASWGAMLRTAYDSFLLHPWQVLVPALAVASAVLAWNLLADGIRAAFGKVEG
jgi:peptide/nickel transport system permease protein